jgi:hypothetical protein
MERIRIRSDNMKEILASIWLSIGSLLGIHEEKVEKPTTVQEHPKPEQAVVQISPPTVAADSSTEATSHKTSNKRQGTSIDNVEYQAPEDAPWMAPVQGSTTISETAQKGQEGQVTTIWGNGTQGQTERTMDHPRALGVDSKHNIYFVDGSQSSAKLRVFDGKQNKTVVDLIENKITRRNGYFISTGLVIIHDNVYISNNEDVFLVKDGRITSYTPKIKTYMENKRLSDIFRMEKHGNYMYLMFMDKSQQFNIARYDTTKGGVVEEIVPTKPMPSPYNFYVHGDNEIFIATTMGYVLWETLFPRETKVAWEFGDPKTYVSDIWIGKDDGLYMVAWENQVKAVLYDNPIGLDANELKPIIGSRRGFVDGFNDEVEMDYPTDFIYDGTGFIFADMGNNAIRKYWTENGPMNQ